MKKRIVCLLLCGALLALLPVCALAAEEYTEYTIEELGITLSLPEEYAVFTRNIKKKDPNLEKYGYTKAYLDGYMQQNDLYLIAMDPGNTMQLMVAMRESTASYLERVDDAALESVLEMVREEYAGGDSEILEMRVFRSGDERYIAAVWGVKSLKAYYYQYSTSRNGKEYTICMNSYIGKDSDWVRQATERIVQSIQYLEPVQAPEPTKPEDFSAGRYSDDYMTDPGAVLALVALATVVIYSLPVLLYRWLRDTPLTRKKARNITLVYGGCFLAVALCGPFRAWFPEERFWMWPSPLYDLITGGFVPASVVLLWTYVNYIILKGGEKQDPRKKKTMGSPYADGPYAPVGAVDAPSAQSGAAETAAPEAETAEPKREVLYCCRCGMRLEPDSNYCAGCGAKRYTEEGTQ